HGETPVIQQDGEIPLIYVGDLCETLLQFIQTGEVADERPIAHRKICRVSELLNRFTTFKETYFAKGVIPHLQDAFDIQLFNTFCGYIDHNTFFPFQLTAHTDARGSFVETLRLEGLGGQVSFSTTKPGITRGNHYHTRKIERFAVIKGKAQIQLRRVGTDETLTFILDGTSPAFVDMPVWATHNITNIGDDDLYTLFWINEFYNPDDPDTFFEEV
ncbi:MAG: epimerase, partial [Kiritimatiellae bacterium]|nr:epimerase [Kiritimatiellia bacterium]